MADKRIRYQTDPWADVRELAESYGNVGSGPINALASALMSVKNAEPAAPEQPKGSTLGLRLRDLHDRLKAAGMDGDAKIVDDATWAIRALETDVAALRRTVEQDVEGLRRQLDNLLYDLLYDERARWVEVDSEDGRYPKLTELSANAADAVLAALRARSGKGGGE